MDFFRVEDEEFWIGICANRVTIISTNNTYGVHFRVDL